MQYSPFQLGEVSRSVVVGTLLGVSGVVSAVRSNIQVAWRRSEGSASASASQSRE